MNVLSLSIKTVWGCANDAPRRIDVRNRREVELTLETNDSELTDAIGVEPIGSNGNELIGAIGDEP